MQSNMKKKKLIFCGAKLNFSVKFERFLMLQMVPLRKTFACLCVHIEVDNRRKKEKERKERITTIASQMNDTKMKKFKKLT